MRLTPFGKQVRVARMDHGITLKEMAEALSISSPLLSSIELGERKLTKTVIDHTVLFFRKKGLSDTELVIIRDAGEMTLTQVEVDNLGFEERGFIAAFARKLSEGEQIPLAFSEWIKK